MQTVSKADTHFQVAESDTQNEPSSLRSVSHYVKRPLEEQKGKRFKKKHRSRIEPAKDQCTGARSDFELVYIAENLSILLFDCLPYPILGEWGAVYYR